MTRTHTGDGSVVSKEQRRRQLAREKYERQQQRRAQARRRARLRGVIIAGVVAVVVASVGAVYASVGLVNGSSPKAGASAASKSPDPCASPAPGTPTGKQWKSEPAMAIDTHAHYTMDLRTTCGDIGLSLNAAAAPHTVNSFAFLAGQGFFDHTRCHRLTTAGLYVLQCGDPTATGQGGPGYTIPDENLNAFGKANSQGVVVYPAGTVAMANTGAPHTGGSQFFLVYKDSPLPPAYTPFGTISPAGMKVLREIAAAGASGGQGDGAPNATVVINKATVSKS